MRATKEYPYSVILYIISRVICIYIIDNTSSNIRARIMHIIIHTYSSNAYDRTTRTSSYAYYVKCGVCVSDRFGQE